MIGCPCVCGPPHRTADRGHAGAECGTGAAARIVRQEARWTSVAPVATSSAAAKRACFSSAARSATTAAHRWPTSGWRTSCSRMASSWRANTATTAAPKRCAIPRWNPARWARGSRDRAPPAGRVRPLPHDVPARPDAALRHVAGARRRRGRLPAARPRPARRPRRRRPERSPCSFT